MPSCAAAEMPPLIFADKPNDGGNVVSAILPPDPTLVRFADQREARLGRVPVNARDVCRLNI